MSFLVTLPRPYHCCCSGHVIGDKRTDRWPMKTGQRGFVSKWDGERKMTEILKVTNVHALVIHPPEALWLFFQREQSRKWCDTDKEPQSPQREGFVMDGLTKCWIQVGCFLLTAAMSITNCNHHISFTNPQKTGQFHNIHSDADLTPNQLMYKPF